MAAACRCQPSVLFWDRRDRHATARLAYREKSLVWRVAYDAVAERRKAELHGQARRPPINQPVPEDRNQSRREPAIVGAKVRLDFPCSPSFMRAAQSK